MYIFLAVVWLVIGLINTSTASLYFRQGKNGVGTIFSCIVALNIAIAVWFGAIGFGGL